MVPQDGPCGLAVLGTREKCLHEQILCLHLNRREVLNSKPGNGLGKYNTRGFLDMIGKKPGQDC